MSFYSFIPHLCVGVGEREYYEKQLATLRTFEEVEALCMPGEFESDESDHGAFEDKEQKQSEFAMKISNYANIVLLVFKVISPRQAVQFYYSRTWVQIRTEDRMLIRLRFETGRCMLRSGRGPWQLQHPRLTRCSISWPAASFGSHTFR